MKQQVRILFFKSPDGCTPCKTLEEYLNNNHAEFTFETVNPFEDTELAIKFNVSSVPTLVAIDKDSKVVGRVNGLDFVKTREVLKLS